MTQRITNQTAESGESASWNPAADFSVQVQVDSKETKLNVSLLGRLDAAAPWVVLGGIRPSEVPLMRSVKVFEAKLTWQNNGGSAINAWSIE